jgi:8-oxo-dGTP diphosphatase
MSDKKLEVGVKAFIFHNNKVLILQRAKPYIGENFTRWDIPGGRINPGEPLQEALAREIKEETNLKITRVIKIITAQYILRDPSKHVVRITYQVECSGTVKTDPAEHSEYQWVTVAQFQKLKHDMFLTPILKEIAAQR